MTKDQQLKFLEMIQSVIKRQGNNSFLIKGWAITISLAGFSLYIGNQSKPILLILVAFTTIIFWVLDASYLKHERLFRKLYEDRANRPGNNFSMDISKHRNGVGCIPCTMVSFPTLLIYAAILVMDFFLYYSQVSIK